jgi:hypothetical protein
MSDPNCQDLWSSWVNGDAIENCVLMGHTIKHWARFGKVLEFLAGATIVVDIIGQHRLERYGDSLDRAIERLSAPFTRWRLFGVPFYKLTIMYLMLFSIPPLVVFLFIVPLLDIVSKRLGPVALTISVLPAFSVFLVIGLKIYGRLIKGIIWILKQPNLASSARAANLLLLVFGFSLDIFGS